MKYAVAVLCLCSLAPAQNRRPANSRNFNINTTGDATSCADLHVTSRGELSQLNQTFTLTRGEAPLLELNVAEHGQIHVRGWDQPNYSVEACKVAVADTRNAADAIARAVNVNHIAGNITFTGPTTDLGDWMVVFFVNAPRDATLNLEVHNGPMEVKGINGPIRLRATNGPIAVSDCGGSVDVQSQNGPIAFNGDRGDVHLTAQNGPIAVNLSKETWNGSLLDVKTVNGPLAVNMPENFRSGMRLETSGHAPFSCQAVQCRDALTDNRSGNRTLQMNGAGDAIRLSAQNGPVAVSSSRQDRRGVR